MKTKLVNRSFMTLILIAVLSTSVFAQQRQGDQKKATKAPQKCEVNAKCMIPDLTDDQKEKIKKLRLQMVKEITPLQSQLREKKARLRTLSIAEKPDMKAINSTIDEIGALDTKIRKIRAQFHQDVRSLLTEDQRIIFDSKKGHVRKRGGNGHGQCKQGPPANKR